MIFNGYYPVTVAFPEVIIAFVEGYTKKPGRKWHSAEFELLQVQQGFQKDLRRYVSGNLPITHTMKHKKKNSLEILLIQRSKRLRVSLRSFDQAFLNMGQLLRIALFQYQLFFFR
jgi:hypothetical protein